MRGRLGEVCSEEEVRSLLTRASKGAVRFAEGKDVLSFTTVKDPHESASLTGARSPVHMPTPGAAATTTALPSVAELDGGETGDVAGGGGAALELVQAFNMGAEVPHPLCVPRVMGVPVVGRELRAAEIKGALNCRVQFKDNVVQFLSRHGRWDKDVRR